MTSSLFDRTTAISVSLLIALALSLYAPRLGDAPIYLSHDEVLFAIHAHAIATTGHDLNGRLMPLYFQIGGGYWGLPIVIYAQAFLLTIFALSEEVIRFPTALVGVLDVVLVYFVVRGLFDGQRPALIAAVLLALTPAHFFRSRVGVDQLFTLPFVLSWLLFLVRYEKAHRPWSVFLATASLGIGFYSYIGAVLMMPLYLLFTCVFLLQKRSRAQHYLAAIVGFIVPLLPLLPWLLEHPAAIADQARRYELYDSQHVGFWRGMLGLFGYTNLTDRAEVYWNAFNPSMLFFSGDSSLLNATRKAGVFLLPMAVFLPIGIKHVMNVRRTSINSILLLGLASAPSGVILVAELSLPRMLVLLPFAIVIATFGVESLLSTPNRTRRIIGVVLLGLLPVQFGFFVHDYFTDYRIRSSRWFEGNIRGALEDILERQNDKEHPAVYLSTDIEWIDAYWQFYLAKHGRQSERERTVYFHSAALDVKAVPERALILSEAGDASIAALVKSGELHELSVVTEPDERPSFGLYER